jgi:hypothetical protein
MKVHAVIFFLSFLCVREVQRFLGNDDRSVLPWTAIAPRLFRTPSSVFF